MEMPSFDKLKIVVGDPSAFMSGLIAGMLRTAGVKAVVEANDSDKLLRTLATRRFDAIFLDADLAPLSGVETTRRLRKEAGVNRDTPVFLVFSAISRNELTAARDAGVSEFIQKPVSASVLELRLKASLGSPRAFVEAPAYVGPDRRRRKAEIDGPDRRRPADAPDSASLEDLGPTFE